jgi:hypothetical protein
MLPVLTCPLSREGGSAGVCGSNRGSVVAVEGEAEGLAPVGCCPCGGGYDVSWW